MNNYKIRTLTISTLFDPKNKNSFCWKHFGWLIHEDNNKRSKISEEQVFCNVCLDDLKNEDTDITFGSAKIKSYSKTVSTGNLLRHLRDDHNIRDDSSGNKKPITDFFAIRPRKTVSTSSEGTSNTVQQRDKWLLARDIAIWFCKSLLPFDTVSDEGTRDFFQKYNIIISKDDMPSSDTIGQTALSDVYENILHKIKNQIEADASRHVALTFDLWSDQYRRLNYITFTLHYIAADFQLKWFTLSTQLIEGKKTGEKIKDYIEKIKENFNIQNREIHTVTDAGANVRRAVTLANLDSHLCLGHGLHNLVTVDGLQKVQEVESLMKKCKKVVKTLRYRLPQLEADAQKEQKSLLAACNLAAEQLDNDEADPIPVEDEEQLESLGQNELFGNPEHVPTIKTSSPTRWHSVLTMLESLAHCCNRGPVNEMLTKIGQNDLKISAQEWNIVEDLIKFLRTFSEAVELLSAQKTVSLNLGLIFRTEIDDVLQSVPDDESLIIQRLKNKMLLNLNKRFPLTENLIAASLLDPRFTNLKQIDKYVEDRKTTKSIFLAETIKKFVINSDVSAEYSRPAPAARDNTLQKLAQKHSNIFFEMDDEVSQECWRYLATASSADMDNVDQGDVLKFWELKKKHISLAGWFRKVTPGDTSDQHAK